MTTTTTGVSFVLNLFQLDGEWVATLFTTEPGLDESEITVIAELSEGRGATPAEATANALTKGSR